MENFAEEDGQVTVIGSNRTERRSIRRRLVQSTLFPHRPVEAESTGDQKGDNCDDDNRNSEDDECCGSQGKKTRKRKGKSTPQDGTSKKTKKKSPVKTTPKKNGTNNASITANLCESEDPSTPIPNLRLEAKLRAEENSRLFAGKQMHPFFSSWKTGRKTHGAAETESNHLVEKKDKNFPIGPIHVFERMQDDVTSIDWKNWTFCEKTPIDTSCGLEGSFTLVLKDSVNAFISDGFPSMLNSHDVSVTQKKVADPHLIQQDSCEKLPMASSTLGDEQVACCQLLGESEGPCDVDEVILSGHADAAGKPDSEKQDIFLDESNQLEDILWADKYQPKKSLEVCGNAESVRCMNEWLHLWHERGFQATEDPSDGDKHNMGDSDYIYDGYDSDSVNGDERDSLKNVLLVTGPVGSGKSAAIHACAREQGFRILESNASECRNGPAVKQKFGEALESHCLTRSLESAVDSYNNHIIESAQAVNDKAVPENDNEVTELIPSLDKEDNFGANGTYGKVLCMESETGNNQTKVRPLIIFEDVDISFQDDRGFVAAIKQIAERAKGPLILTSNDKNPVLPDNLDRLELCFSMPSSKELLCHLSKICAAEEINIQPHLIEQLSEYYQGDIRKTIMHLQFWCQSRRHRTAGKVQKTYGPLLFDLEAGHQILPKVIPWDFPSQLSELIEKEIAEALSVEGNSREGVNEDAMCRLGIQNIRTDFIELKKERLLRRNCSFNATSEIPNSTRTQNSLLGKTILRTRKLVVSSDSEDELLNDRYHVASNKNTDNSLFFEDDSRFPSNYPRTKHDTKPSIDMPLYFEAENFLGNCCYSEIGNGNSWLSQICQSVDISCVPESSFVPETEINNETEVSSRTVSYCNVAETCDAIAGSSEEEELDDFDDNDVVSVSGEFQVMDECSRIDFNRRSKPMEKLKFRMNDLVQESWKKLRDNHKDLKQYVASEPKHALQILECTFGMCNVISESDLLLSHCPNKDSLELSDNEHLQMASTVAQHGFCINARDISCQPNVVSQTNVDFRVEMLISKTNMTALRRTVEEEFGVSNTSNGGQVSEMSSEKCEIMFERHLQCSEKISCLFNIIKSLVPRRASLAVKGVGFHEYVSALRSISRSDASHHLEGVDNGRKQRSRRAARHYLSTGALSLSPEDISLLSQYSMYGKATS